MPFHAHSRSILQIIRKEEIGAGEGDSARTVTVSSTLSSVMFMADLTDYSWHLTKLHNSFQCYAPQPKHPTESPLGVLSFAIPYREKSRSNSPQISWLLVV